MNFITLPKFQKILLSYLLKKRFNQLCLKSKALALGRISFSYLKYFDMWKAPLPLKQ